MLPRLFIGSSREAKDAGLLDILNHALDTRLNTPDQKIAIVPWPASPWANLDVAVSSLVANLVDYSYGIFILSADDELSLRGTPHYAARDNVIFELGLFLAYLGPKRTFLIGPADISKSIAMSAVKTTVPHTTPPPELPLRILSDLGGAYRMGNYVIINPGPTPTITFNIDEVVTAITDIEAKSTSLPPPDAHNELTQRILEARAKLAETGRTDAFYSGEFFARFREIATLKARATAKSVQNVTQDLLLSLERVPDFCDTAELARTQHHTNGVNEVWVFADKPLEFRAGARVDPASIALRKTIIENLTFGVKYRYFVGPDFAKTDIDHLVDHAHPDRAKILKSIHVVKVNSHFFSTYFTLHFQRGAGRGPKAIYMSSVMRDRKDILIQVSDDDHVKRIFDRISILLGDTENEDSPTISNFVFRS